MKPWLRHALVTIATALLLGIGSGSVHVVSTVYATEAQAAQNQKDIAEGATVARENAKRLTEMEKTQIAILCAVAPDKCPITP